MSYARVKCWWCGEIPHPLDTDHHLWCAPWRNNFSKEPRNV